MSGPPPLWLRFPTSHMGCVNQWGPIVHNVLGSLKNIPKGRLTQQEKPQIEIIS